MTIMLLVLVVIPTALYLLRGMWRVLFNSKPVDLDNPQGWVGKVDALMTMVLRAWMFLVVGSALFFTLRIAAALV